jgi:hypothetical protein
MSNPTFFFPIASGRFGFSVRAKPRHSATIVNSVVGVAVPAFNFLHGLIMYTYPK